MDNRDWNYFDISGAAYFRKKAYKRLKAMDLQNEKCVMVIDEHLPLGIIANTAAIMGITLGKKMPEVVGAESVRTI